VSEALTSEYREQPKAPGSGAAAVAVARVEEATTVSSIRRFHHRPQLIAQEAVMAPDTTSTARASTLTGPGPDTEPDPKSPVEEFTTSFDFDDDSHCGDPVENVIADLPDSLRALADRLRPLDTDDARDLLEQFIQDYEETEDGGAPEIDMALSDALSQLNRCREGCDCAADAWQGYGKEMIDDGLADLDGYRWALYDVNHLHYIEDLTSLTFEEIRVETIGSGASWSAFEIHWTGERLEVRFDSNRCFEVIALNPVQEMLARRWENAEYDPQDVNCAVLDAGPNLSSALDIWESVDNPEDHFDELSTLVGLLDLWGAAWFTTSRLTLLHRLRDLNRSSVAEIVVLIDTNSADISAALQLWDSTTHAVSAFGNFSELLSVTGTLTGSLLTPDMVQVLANTGTVLDTRPSGLHRQLAPTTLESRITFFADLGVDVISEQFLSTAGQLLTANPHGYTDQQMLWRTTATILTAPCATAA
jgi:hypothetical protein